MIAAGPHLVLFYDYVEDVVARRAPHRAAHLELLQGEIDAGRVVMGGALGDPVSGAAIVFTGDDAGAVERFVSRDPYVREGLVTGHRVVPWNVAVSA
jgi:uncharacterized protein YciI